MSSSQRPARQRNILDYSILGNVGREEALIQRATKPNSSLNINSNSNSNIDCNIDPALEISYNPTANSATNLPIHPTYLEHDHLLANDYIISSDSNIDNESPDVQSNPQPSSSDINPSKSVLQIKSASASSIKGSWVYPYFESTILDGQLYTPKGS